MLHVAGLSRIWPAINTLSTQIRIIGFSFELPAIRLNGTPAIERVKQILFRPIVTSEYRALRKKLSKELVKRYTFFPFEDIFLLLNGATATRRGECWRREDSNFEI